MKSSTHYGSYSCQARFYLADQQTKVFNEAKQLVSTAPCLRYFDVCVPVVLQVDASEYGLGAALLQHSTNLNASGKVQLQPVTYSSTSLTPTEQRYAQIEKETLAIVHAFRKFDQLLFGKSNVTVHTDHKPLKNIFNRPLAAAPRRLQSMMPTLQRYTFKVEYHKGSTLLIADALSRAPLPTSSHKPVHDEMVYHVKLEADTPDLSGFQDRTLQDIRATAVTDPELTEVQALIESGRPTSVPQLATDHTGLYAVSTRYTMGYFSNKIVSSSLPLSAKIFSTSSAHRGPEFILRQARNCVFWPGITSQIINMCKACLTCAQHAQQHPREPLQPYPVPTLPWQLVSQDLFQLNGLAHLETVDHYSDFYEIDRLPTIQSSAVIQATKKHFGQYGVPHTLITDNGAF